MDDERLEAALSALQKREDFFLEDPSGVPDEDFSAYRDELLAETPALAKQTAYLAFLRRTGGVNLENDELSLGLYGFSGELVPSVTDEGPFVDQERYFQFGEVLYSGPPEERYVFALDLQSDSQAVWVSPFESSAYVPCCGSIVDLLEAFAAGRRPGKDKPTPAG
ncbi:hypothetical protein [Polyangium sp. y55x31]|uniref:hypothetical protein n=1 Tax=Polyangium sp. y55x31 TaxID=3042688 RepID=UPI0024821B46|nr:hypothetical protein [Polyangium sp. y55x31]MDI1478914.1 hypothetical protein [Polyangium sp. y55x31]